MSKQENEKQQDEKQQDALKQNAFLKKLFGSKYAYLIVLAFGVIILIWGMNDFKPTETVAPSDYTTYLENRLENILSKLEGVNETHVMITTREVIIQDKRGDTAILKDATPEVEGVVVVANAKDSNAKQDIFNAVLAALDVKPHKVQIYLTSKKEMN